MIESDLKLNYVEFSFLLFFVNVVMQKFDDQVNVSQDHASAAIPFTTKLV